MEKKDYVGDMQNVTSVELKRDCEATQIPSGEATTLPAGLTVDITQTLGGTYTVRPPSGGLFRIAAKDADALGIQPDAPVNPACETASADGPVEEKEVWETLRSCYDPEIPVNIVDLGPGVRHEDRAIAHGAQWRGGEDDIDRARLRDGISDRRRRATTPACAAGSGRGECRDRLGTPMASFDDFRAGRKILGID